MKMYNVKEKAYAAVCCGTGAANIVNGIALQLSAMKKAGEAKSFKDAAMSILYEGAAIACMGIGIADVWIGIVKTNDACFCPKSN